MLNRISISWFFLLAVSIVWSQEKGKDWPQINGFADRLSFSPSRIAPPFKLDKTIETGLFIESFTYSQGVIYIAAATGAENTFRAVDLTTGEFLWTYQLPNTVGNVGFHAAISGDLVYVGGQKADGLYALDRMTGDSVWFQPTGALFGRNVAIEGDLIYVNAHGSRGGLMCFNKKTGEKQWEFSKSTPQNVCPVDSGKIYLYNNDTIYALDRFTGQLNWKRGTSYHQEDYSMLVHDDRVVVKSGMNISVLSTSDGSALIDTILNIGTGIDLRSNSITYTTDSYIIHEWIESADSFGIQRIKQENGETIWSKKLAPRSWGTPIAFGEYFTLVNGDKLEIRDIETGEVVQSFEDERYHNITRPKVTDFGILASIDSRINIFRPVLTNFFKTSDEMPFSLKIFENPGHVVRFEIDSERSFSISYQLIDLLGRAVTEPVSEITNSGSQEFEISAGVPVGVYFLGIKVGNRQFAGKVVLK